MPISRCFLVGLSPILLVLMLFLSACRISHPTRIERQQQAFIHHWVNYFSTPGLTPDALQSNKDLLFLNDFPDKSWLAISMEHACCTGAGFNAVIIRDSTGAIYVDNQRRFCGVQIMNRELHDLHAQSAADLLRKLPLIDLHPTPVPPVPHE